VVSILKLVDNRNMNRRVVEIRKYNDLNQTEFAKKLGFTQSNLSAIELGKIPLTEANIRLICLTFSVREEWLRDGKGEMLDNEALLSEYEKWLLVFCRRLSPTAQKLFIEYAEKLLSDEQTLRGETSPIYGQDAEDEVIARKRA
jgi:transcriptional regulator with XRE-family HTH domain